MQVPLFKVKVAGAGASQLAANHMIKIQDESLFMDQPSASSAERKEQALEPDEMAPDSQTGFHITGRQMHFSQAAKSAQRHPELAKTHDYRSTEGPDLEGSKVLKSKEHDRESSEHSKAPSTLAPSSLGKMPAHQPYSGSSQKVLIKSKITNTSRARQALKFQQFKDFSQSSNLMLIQQLQLQEGQRSSKHNRNRDLGGIREPIDAGESGRTTKRQQSCSPNQEPSTHIEVIATLRPKTDSKQSQATEAVPSPEKHKPTVKPPEKPKKISPQRRLMASSRNKLLQSHFRTCKDEQPESPSMIVVESKQKQINQPAQKQAANMSRHLHKILGMQRPELGKDQRPKVSIVTNMPPVDCDRLQADPSDKDDGVIYTIALNPRPPAAAGVGLHYVAIGQQNVQFLPPPYGGLDDGPRTATSALWSKEPALSAKDGALHRSTEIEFAANEFGTNSLTDSMRDMQMLSDHLKRLE